MTGAEPPFEVGDEVVAVDAIRDGDLVSFTRKGKTIEIHLFTQDKHPTHVPLFRARRGIEPGSMSFEPVTPEGPAPAGS